MAGEISREETMFLRYVLRTGDRWSRIVVTCNVGTVNRMGEDVTE
jgi:hypothetical protein